MAPAGDNKFAVENTLRRELLSKWLEHLREIAIQGLFFAALNEDFVFIAEDENAKAVPFGFVDPVAAGRNLIDAFGEHGEQWRVDGKIHAFRSV